MGTARGAHDLALLITQWSITVVGKMDGTNYFSTMSERDKNTSERKRWSWFQQCHSTSHFPTNMRTSPGIDTVNALGREHLDSDASCVHAQRLTTTMHSDWQKESNKVYPPVLMVAPPVRDAASPAARKRICEDTSAWRQKDERLVVVQFSVTDSKSLSTPASWRVPRNMINGTPDDVGRTNESKVLHSRYKIMQELKNDRDWRNLPLTLPYFFLKKVKILITQKRSVQAQLRLLIFIVFENMIDEMMSHRCNSVTWWMGLPSSSCYSKGACGKCVDIVCF